MNNAFSHLPKKSPRYKTGAFKKYAIDQDGLMMIRFLPIT